MPKLKATWLNGRPAQLDVISAELLVESFARITANLQKAELAAIEAVGHCEAAGFTRPNMLLLGAANNAQGLAQDTLESLNDFAAVGELVLEMLPTYDATDNTMQRARRAELRAHCKHQVTETRDILGDEYESIYENPSMAAAATAAFTT